MNHIHRFGLVLGGVSHPAYQQRGSPLEPPVRELEACVYRFLGCALSTLLLGCCLAAFSGCPKEEGVRRVWILNDGDRVITGLYGCADPREEDWGENLLSASVEAHGFAFLGGGVPADQPWWVWPHLDGHGLMAVCLVPGDADIFLAVTRTLDGDYRVQTVGASMAPVCARYLLE